MLFFGGFIGLSEVCRCLCVLFFVRHSRSQGVHYCVIAFLGSLDGIHLNVK